MNHFHSLNEIETFLEGGGTFAGGRKFAFKQSWVAIGSFDGVHLGHQALLSPMIEEAHAQDAAAVVVTFHPHPVVVLRGLNEPIYLTSPDERALLLSTLGMDAVLTLPFDRALASLSAEEFMGNMVRYLGLKKLWAGQDFALGRNRQGNIPTLREIGSRLGFTVQVMDILEKNHPPEGEPEKAKVSSSRIRDLVRRGEVVEAAALLGRPYALEGPVVRGEGRGHSLGFPTANVDYWPEKIAPALGVYATWVWVDGQRLPSVTNVGLNPTFTNELTQPRVEAFLIDYEGDLYGQEMRVEFLEFLRPELRFDSAQALVEQMHADTSRAREVLTHAA